MIDPAEAGRAFDAAFMARAAAGLSVRLEQAGDEDFLRGLFLAAYPLLDVLPALMLKQQADLQFAAFRHNYPAAMRRIAVREQAPIGRIIVDWGGEGVSHCADIAVEPAHGGRGVGSAMLQAWIDASIQLGLACTLTVAHDNPAQALYRRLGFRESSSAPGAWGEAAVGMIRPLGG